MLSLRCLIKVFARYRTWINTKVNRSKYPFNASTVPIYFIIIESDPIKFKYALKLAWLSFSLRTIELVVSFRHSSSILILNPKRSSFKNSFSSFSGLSWPINEYTIVLRVCTVFLLIAPFFFINFDRSSLMTMGSTSTLCCSASLGIFPAFYSFLLYSPSSSLFVASFWLAVPLPPA